MTELSKSELRRLLRRARQALSPAEQAQASELFLTQLARCYRFDNTHIVAVYLSADGEVDLTPSIAWLRQCGAQLVLPIVEDMAKPLRFALFDADTALIESRLRILEPVSKQFLETSELTHVLMPLVGFDDQRHRLGMGGGFYDRTFAPDQANVQRPLLIGVAHECQRLASVPTDPWDVPLDRVITAQQCY